MTTLDEQAVSFYWVDGANGRVVSHSLKVNGAATTRKATFDVRRPHRHGNPAQPVTLTTQTDIINVRTIDGEKYIAFGRDEANPGILFEATFPAETYGGELGFIQLVTVDDRDRFVEDGRYWRWQGTGLDSSVPYNTLPGLGITSDSPAASLLVGWDLVDVNQSFEMYLMYKPDTPDSIWVPLRKVEWFWRATVLSDDGGHTWVLQPGSAHSVNPTDVATTAHPEWNRNIVNIPWEVDD